MAKSVRYTTFSGINNTDPPERLKQPDYRDPQAELAAARNIDINRTGEIVRRPGRTILNGIPTTSLWSTADGLKAFGIQGTALVSLKADYSPTVLNSGFSSAPAYFTEANGVVYVTNGVRIGQVAGGVYSDFNATLKQFESLMPAGENIEYFAGRMFVAVGPVLWFSEAFRFQVRYRKDNFKQFPADIDMIAVVDDGLYVSAGGTVYFLLGTNPHKFAPLASVVAFGAYKGMKTYIPGNLLGEGKETDRYPVWAGSGGLCVGMNSGRVVNMTSEKFNVPQGSTGAGVIRKSANGNHFIGVVR